MDTLVNLQFLVDDAKCFDTVRRLRRPEGVRCARCGSDKVARDGRDDRQPERQRYRCTACQGRFDDLSDTIFAGHHQPLRIWILCLYFMGVNLVWAFQCQAVSYSSLQCQVFNVSIPMFDQRSHPSVPTMIPARRRRGRRSRMAVRPPPQAARP